jgi:hypothetical protein
MKHLNEFKLNEEYSNKFDDVNVYDNLVVIQKAGTKLYARLTSDGIEIYIKS